MRLRLAFCVSALTLAAVAAPTAASAAVGNPYSDGKDLAVAGTNPFRLDGSLEPGCFHGGRLVSDGLIDIGDDNEELQVRVFDFARFSIDQVLVAGENSGYKVYNTFDTGTSSTDADIDPNQTGTDMQAQKLADGSIDDVAEGATIVCVSDHEDSGQNEPYVNNGLPGEVAAVNRPVIQPTVATLGQGAFNGIAKTYKMGFGYKVEKWYSPYTIADSPAFTLDWTDPMAFGNNPDGSNTPSHIRIPARIEGPGVLRVNDIDVAGEEFDDPHFERANYGQTDVFNVASDPKSFCLGGPCPGLISFGTQGDLPVSWAIKASLATTDSLRKVSFTPADFDKWEQGWQDYYCGKGAHPTLPLSPGTNSPDPRDCPVIVNPQESRPTTAPTVNVLPTPVSVNVPASNAAKTCKSTRVIKFRFAKKAKRGVIKFRGHTVRAKRSHGRLRARADMRGYSAVHGSLMKVTVSTRYKSGRLTAVQRVFKVC